MSEVIKTILTGDSSQLRAEFGKAAALVSNYHAQQKAGFSKSLAAHDLELRALQLEADGFKTLATSMRETATLREQAGRLAASANITEKAALDILEKKYLLQKNIALAAEREANSRQATGARAAAIANPRATGLPGLPGGLAPLTPQSLQLIDRTIASQRELRRQTLALGRSGKSGALGFLALSQAFEDVQYGIRGVLNNIPQAVLGFGGGPGLAGVLSIAAVSAVALYPRLQALYGFGENKALQKVAEDVAQVFKKGLEAAKAIRREYEETQKLVVVSGQYNQALTDRLQLSQALTSQNDEQLAADRKSRDMALEILDARKKLAEARGESTAPVEQQQTAAENSGRQADLKNRKEELARSQREQERLFLERTNLAAESAAQEAAAKQELVRLTENLAGAEANLADSIKNKEEVQKGRSGTARQNLQIADQKRAVESLKQEIEAYTKRSAALKESLATAKTEADQTSKQLDAKTQKAYDEVKALEALIAQRKELQQLEADTKAAEAAAAARKKAADEARGYFKEWKKEQEERKARDEEEASFRSARADLGTEISALRLENRGRKDLADKLREEYQLRKDAITLAKQAGVTELQAIALLREKARLEEGRDRAQATGARATARGRGIRPDQGGRSVNLGRIEIGGGRIESGIRGGILGRRASERAAAAVTPSDPGLKLLERSTDLQEQMLGVFKKLGVY